MVCHCCGEKHPKLKQFTVGDGLVVTENKRKAILREIFKKYTSPSKPPSFLHNDYFIFISRIIEISFAGSKLK